MEPPEAENGPRALTEKERDQRVMAPMKHGSHSFYVSGTFAPCKKCFMKNECPEYQPEGIGCPPFTRILEETIAANLRLPWLQPVDTPLVVEHAQLQVFLMWGRESMKHIGVLRIHDGNLDVHNLVGRMQTAVSTMVKLSDRLGFNPISRKLLAFNPNQAPKDPEQMMAFIELKRKLRTAEERTRRDGDGTGKAP